MCLLMRGVLHDYNYITTCTHQGDDYFVGAKLQIITSMKYSYPPPWHILLSTYYSGENFLKN